MTSSSPAHLDWLDSVRALACVLVVLLHTASPIAGAYTPTDKWMAANVIDAAARACVPLFFMVSGFLFFRTRAPGWRNFKRLVAALLFYSFIYIALRGTMTGQVEPGDIAAILAGPVHFHLWFFYPQIAIYVVAAFVCIRTPSPAALGAAAVALLVLNPSVDALTGLDTSALRAGGDLFYYVLYAIMGAILGQRAQEGHALPGAPISLIVFLAATAAIAILTKLASEAAGEFVGDFYRYRSPLVALAAISIFCILAQSGPPRRIASTVSFLSRHSLAIYGLHAIPLELVRRSPIMDHDSGLVVVLLSFGLVMAATLPLAMALKRIDRGALVS